MDKFLSSSPQSAGSSVARQPVLLWCLADINSGRRRKPWRKIRREKMTETNQTTGETPSTPSEKELYRELIEQFYEGSVDRYGVGSEQARTFSQLLGDAS